MGGVAGDVVVNRGGTLALKGVVGGKVIVREGGAFHNGR